jgi:hypothetical protein
VSGPSFERHEARTQHHAPWWTRIGRRPDTLFAVGLSIGAAALWWYGRPAFSASEAADFADAKKRAVEVARNRGEVDTRTPMVKTESAVRALADAIVAPSVPEGTSGGPDLSRNLA